MGLGDFFKRRKQRESAIPPASTEVETLGSFATSEGQPVVGNQVEQAATGFAVPGVWDTLSQLPAMFSAMKDLEHLAPQIQQAMANGQMTQNPDGSYSWANVTFQAGQPQVIDMRGSGLREEMSEIMKRHGYDMEAGQMIAGGQMDAQQAMAMQQEILAAIAKHGVPGIPGQASDDAPPPPAE